VAAAAATLRAFPMNSRARHHTALLMLLLANLFWGLSFPLIKAIGAAHLQLVPESSNWFITAMCIAPRFLLGVVFMLAISRSQLANATGGEVRQGLLLGVAASCGMLFQTDGLQFTTASVSAFLTQFYALMIPLYVAVRARAWPRPVVWVCSALVLGGVAVLSGFNFAELHLGRGELETLISSGFFMWQILVLENKRFAGNRVLPVTTVMFATQAVIFTVMALATAPTPGAVLLPWTSVPWLGFTLVLTVFCTIGSFTLMNQWQPSITATEAGLIYCTEPIFTSVMALFLPGLFSAWAGFHYANETLTWNLLLGGGLITAANLLIQLRPPKRTAAQPVT
jgi:drug/metabolite transporter (DMT)-like permease